MKKRKEKLWLSGWCWYVVFLQTEEEEFFARFFHLGQLKTARQNSTGSKCRASTKTFLAPHQSFDVDKRTVIRTANILLYKFLNSDVSKRVGLLARRGVGGVVMTRRKEPHLTLFLALRRGKREGKERISLYYTGALTIASCSDEICRL